MKAPALIAALIIVAGMPDVTFAQTRKSSASPQDLLRRVFELVAMDDLTNAAAVEEKLGVTFVSVRNSEGQERVRLQKYDKTVFEDFGHYSIQQPFGKPWQQVRLELILATDKMCIRESDFRAVFGAAAGRLDPLHGGASFMYSYKVQLYNQMRIDGIFLDGRCLFELSMSQNIYRQD